MTVYISGGCKNGKSTLAERAAVTLAGNGPLYYLATMIPHDEEDRARIRRHVASRAGLGFQTIERGTNITSCINGDNCGGSFLLDSVTALLSNEMFHENGVDLSAPSRVAEELIALTKMVNSITFVSDYIYSDTIHYDGLTESYRKGLADIDRALAAVCDTVVEVCYGNHMIYKGKMPF